ncbi:hypothetical protein PspLS_07621 [Pyricularia sp. CBS 133598]|nr:hypothetical protein PspLS_07621 [Pyricularia sp. CBS 133598]
MTTPPKAIRKRDRVLSWFRRRPVDTDEPAGKGSSRGESSSPEPVKSVDDDPKPAETAETPVEETPQDISLDLWDAAYQQLKADSAELMAEYESALEAVDPAAAALRDGTASQKVQAMQAVVTRAGVSKHGEKAVAAAQVTAKVLDLIKDTVTELAQANPVAAFAWAGFCVITPHLLAPIMEKQAMRDGLGHVSGRLSWFMALTRVLLRESWSEDADFGQFRKEVYSRTAGLYRKLLEFEVRCVCACASPFKTAAKDILGWNGWGDLVASIKVAEAALNAEIDRYSTETTKEYLREIAEQSRHLEDMVRLQEESVAFQQRAEDRAIAEKRNDVIKKFDRVEYEDQLAKHGLDRVPGTCAWLSHDDTYRRWCENAKGAPQMLVVTAGPGWGKSVLTKYLIKERLQQDLAGSWAVCYFFFSHNHAGMNSASNALHAMVHQLLSQQRHLVDRVTEEVEKLGSGQFGISSLIRILSGAMSSVEAEPTVFVFDALDECNPAELSDVVRFLESVRLPNVRFVVTTRPWPNILEDLEKGLGVGSMAVIAAETLQHNDKLQDEILMHRDRLAILFDLIMVAQRPLTVEEVSVALWIRTHPETSSLEEVDADEPDVFQKWVVETSGLFVLVFHGKLFFIHQTCREYLLRKVEPVSSKLLLRGPDDAPFFASSTTEPQAHATAAECCLLYLLLRPLSDGYENEEPVDTDSKKDASSFMTYSAVYLTHHFGLSQRYEKVGGESRNASLKLVDINPSLRPLYLRLFRKQLRSKHGCLRLIQPLCSYGDGDNQDYANIFVKDGELLVRYIAPGFGIESGCRSKSPIYIMLDGKTSDGPPSLRTLGLLTGHVALFEEGGDEGLETPEPPIYVYYNVEKEPVSALDKYFTKPAAPLYRASAMDGVHIVKWLADKGVDLSAKDDDGNSALHAVVRHPFFRKQHSNTSSVETLKVLLDAGVSPSTANNSGLIPLLSAAKLMDWDAVRFLIERGGSPNFADKGGVTLLMLATFDETPEPARMMLDRGADVNACDGGGRTALHWAFMRGASAAMMDVLISQGIDVNKTDNLGNTALGAALKYLGSDADVAFEAMFNKDEVVSIGPNSSSMVALQKRVEKGLGLLDHPEYVQWKADCES